MDRKTREIISFDDRADALLAAAGDEGTTPDGFFYTYGAWTGGPDRGDLWRAYAADGVETPGDVYAPVQRHVRTGEAGYEWSVEVNGETIASGRTRDAAAALRDCLAVPLA